MVTHRQFVCWGLADEVKKEKRLSHVNDARPTWEKPRRLFYFFPSIYIRKRKKCFMRKSRPIAVVHRETNPLTIVRVISLPYNYLNVLLSASQPDGHTFPQSEVRRRASIRRARRWKTKTRVILYTHRKGGLLLWCINRHSVTTVWKQRRRSVIHDGKMYKSSAQVPVVYYTQQCWMMMMCGNQDGQMAS